MDAVSLSELYSRRKEQYLNDCDLCGICVEACPVLPLTSLRDVPAPDIQRKVMETLRDGAVSDEAVARASSCSHCNTCRDSCPLEINPVILQELLQLELVRLSGKARPLMEFSMGERTFFVPDMVASMQIRPEQRVWLSNVPDRPQPKKVVVFAGCTMVMMPDKIFLVHDILAKLGLDYIILAGGELCCGARYAGTDINRVDAQARWLLQALNAFHPQQVVFCCAECAARVDTFSRLVGSVPFEYDEIFHFLSNNIPGLGLKPVTPRKVTLHDPCSMTRLLGDSSSLRRLIKAIPGLELVEMDKTGDLSRCCGAVTSRRLKKVGSAMTRQIMESAQNTGASVLVDACQGCHFQFSPWEQGYSFKIENMLSLIGEAMGFSFEDKIKRFYRCGNAAEIMKECRSNVEAGPYDPDLIAMIAGYMFGGPSPTA